jgi:proline dehydrogenase
VAVLDVIQTPAFQQRFFFVAKRFIAGERAEDALDVVAGLNAAGMSATLDFLGEDVVSLAEAERTRDAYLSLLAAIRVRDVTTNVSVKLSAIGLLLDGDVALANLRAIRAAAAANRDPFVRIDMEGSAVAEQTLRLCERAFAENPAVGPVLQAYLRRTPADVERAIALGMRVRLCKGAYREPRSVAYGDMPTIRRAYLRAAETLLERGVYPAIATHDARLIRAVQRFAVDHGIGPERFEFQMLYGVRPELQRRLVAEGWRLRIYVPYGTHWAGYFYRRISERPENALFALRSLLSR